MTKFFLRMKMMEEVREVYHLIKILFNFEYCGGLETLEE